MILGKFTRLSAPHEFRQLLPSDIWTSSNVDCFQPALLSPAPCRHIRDAAVTSEFRQADNSPVVRFDLLSIHLRRLTPKVVCTQNKPFGSLCSIDTRTACPFRPPHKRFGQTGTVFRSVFSASAFLSIALTRPLHRGCLVAPSEEHFHGQAPATRPEFVKGDGQKTHSRAEKKRP